MLKALWQSHGDGFIYVWYMFWDNLKWHRYHLRTDRHFRTITAASKANKTTMSPANLISFFSKEAQHQVYWGGPSSNRLNRLCNSGSGSKDKKGKGQDATKGKKSDVSVETQTVRSEVTPQSSAWAKGGGQEGQDHIRKKGFEEGGKAKVEASANVAASEDCSRLCAPPDFCWRKLLNFRSEGEVWCYCWQRC